MINGTFEGWPEAWYYALEEIMASGENVPTEYGTRARMVNGLQLCLTDYKEAWHKRDPFCSKNTVEAYKKEFTYEFYTSPEYVNNPQKKFEYTYFQRFTEMPVADAREVMRTKFNQLEWVHQQLTAGRTDTKRLNIATWLPGIDNYTESPPCLQRMWFYPHANHKVDVTIDYRSWDWYRGAGSNIVGLIYMVKEHVLKDTEFTLGNIILHGDNVHVYEDEWEKATTWTLKRGLFEKITGARA